MKKRVLSLFLALTLCLTLLPTAAFAEGTNGSAISSEAAAAEGGQPTATGAPTEGGGQLTNTGEGEQPNSETDTLTEIWCVSKPDSIGRSYDGTTNGSTIPIDLTFTDGTNSIILKEGTDFTAKKTFDSADAGDHTVTVELELIGDAAAKYKLKTNNIPTRAEYTANPSSAVEAPSSSEAVSSSVVEEKTEYQADYRVDKTGGGSLTCGDESGKSLTVKVTSAAQSVKVTAVPEDGYVFVKWSDGVTKRTRTDTNFDQNVDVTAVFAAASIQVSSSGKAGLGDSYTFKATLKGKYLDASSIRWYVNGSEVTQAAGKTTVKGEVDPSMVGGTFRVYATASYNDCTVTSNKLELTVSGGTSGSTSSSSSSSSSSASSKEDKPASSKEETSSSKEEKPASSKEEKPASSKEEKPASSSSNGTSESAGSSSKVEKPASSAASSKEEKPVSSSQSSSSSKEEKPASSKEEKPASSKTEVSASKEAAN